MFMCVGRAGAVMEEYPFVGPDEVTTSLRYTLTITVLSEGRKRPVPLGMVEVCPAGSVGYQVLRSDLLERRSVRQRQVHEYWGGRHLHLQLLAPVERPDRGQARCRQRRRVCSRITYSESSIVSLTSHGRADAIGNSDEGGTICRQASVLGVRR